MSLKICKSKVIFNIISFLLKKQTSVSMSSVTSEKSFKFIDIGANLTDPVYQGIYNGSTKHEADLSEVLTRAYDNGLEKLIITGGNLEDSKAALKLAEQKNCLYCTVGCHPTRCQDFEKSNPEEYLQQLKSLAAENKSKVVAVGECGLDYERLHFCPKEIQQKYFEWQFEIAEATNLPMFLHCRNSVEDLLNIIQKNRDRFSNGVVHSFDGNAEEAKAIIDLGLYIGINGCSLKTPENLEVVSKIPIDRLMIETDCPWCEIRPTHAGYKYIKTTYPSKKKEKWESGFLVKSRNEPVNIVQVLEVLAAVLEEDSHSLAEIIYENTNKVFFSK